VGRYPVGRTALCRRLGNRLCFWGQKVKFRHGKEV
jgi:hypothetical protein